MASVVRMPSVLAGAQEAAIATWLVAPGDTVAVGDPLAEIETEKAVVEYGAEEAGVVGRIVLAAGDSGEIGVPIAVLVQEGETDADIDAALSGGAAAAAPEPAMSAASPAPDPAAPSARDAAAPSAPAPATASAPASSGPHGPADPAPRRPYESEPIQAASQGRIFASPIVRRIARQEGIDLASITGSGPNGRIVRRDLERLASQPGRLRARPATGPRRLRSRPPPRRPPLRSRPPLRHPPRRLRATRSSRTRRSGVRSRAA